MNLKWIIGGQVNPIISIIIDDNNNNKVTITITTTTTITIIKISKHSTERFSAPIPQVGWRKVFTSTAAFRLQELSREVELFLCGRPRDHEIVSQ